MADAVNIKLGGDETLRRILAAGSGKTVIAVGGALLQCAQLVMRASLEQVPVKDAVLKGSATINDPKFSNGLIKVVMGYGGAASAYALYQHNAPDGWHYTRPGSKSHYLSDPLMEALPVIEKTLAFRIGQMLQAAGA